jgi:cyclopropane-fatty-acyl-phospholipid synthase
MKKLLISLMEKGVIPDAVIRAGIRRLLRKRLQHERRKYARYTEALQSFIDELRQEPVAVQTEKPKEQHYELPPSFFHHILGKWMKYSCNYWQGHAAILDESEEAMLEIICKRADIHDGMDILDLGCGWGALSLWISGQFPNSRILSVSNSIPQREYIEGQCRERGLGNVTIETADMNDFKTERRFDRIVSIEMFEHMRNWEELMWRISQWLKQEGKLFVHIFCHRQFSYFFETEGAHNWMGRYFFTAGMMPSEELILKVQTNLILENKWRVNGMHYRKTAEEWLKNMDGKRKKIIPILESVYGQEKAALWFQRWRIFFMACSELWGYDRGQEWFVSHYLFHRG